MHVDPLTGLPNRAALFARLNDRLGRGERLSLLFIDLDGFKAINDAHGHPVDDDALREVGERLRGAVRSTDVVARIGGDEFVILVEEPDDALRAPDIAERAIARITEPLASVARAPNRVGASFGLALAPRDATRPDALLRYAYTAMYRAKAAGGNTWRAWRPGDDAKAPAGRSHARPTSRHDAVPSPSTSPTTTEAVARVAPTDESTTDIDA